LTHVDVDVDMDVDVVLDADVVAVVCLDAPKAQGRRYERHVWYRPGT